VKRSLYKATLHDAEANRPRSDIKLVEPRPLKQLGQHFLTDVAIAKQIVSLGELKAGDAVWEIGPGRGILTEAILSHPVKLTAFELDLRMREVLRQRFAGRCDLVMNDVLRMDWDQMISTSRSNSDQPIKLISNIPYQITSPLLYRIEKYASCFSLIVLMVQKELAHRLCAHSGTKDYGLLTVRVGLHYLTSIQIQVPAHNFDPPPKVDSSVILMTPRPDRPQIKYLDAFHRMLNAVFMHRRKTLRNNLVSMIGKTAVAELEHISPIDLQRRGETLSEQEFIALSDLLGGLL